MNLLEGLSSITLNRAAFILLVLFDLGCGILVVFVCWPDLTIQLDAIKLIMLAGAVTLPCAALGTLLYQVGIVGQDYDALGEGLNKAVIFAFGFHIFVILMALGPGSLASEVPNPAWLPPPLSAERRFWYGSGLYVTYMFYAGRNATHGIGRRLFVPILTILLVGGGLLVGYYGRWKQWW